jgi:uncharacterized protein
MAGATLLALLDDIAAVLDDVAVLTKVAAKKSAGVLGDDLALNAQQVAGVHAARELHVIWAVALGSLRNKLILVPTSLLISQVAPWAISPLLMLGGAFLCFEGAEKVWHSVTHRKTSDKLPLAEGPGATSGDAASAKVTESEASKIKGAIRTDFILSGEIIVISLGAVAGESLLTRAGVLCAIALLMTVGVYGLVACIIKMDDLGLWLSRRSHAIARGVGSVLLSGAPPLMKVLSIVGTAAMFLVGGGILRHAIHLQPGLAGWLGTAADGAVGMAAGIALLSVFAVVQRLRRKV